jgi:hypothetical protein
MRSAWKKIRYRLEWLGLKSPRKSFRFCRAKLDRPKHGLRRDKIVGDITVLSGAEDDWLAPASLSSPHD